MIANKIICSTALQVLTPHRFIKMVNAWSVLYFGILRY